jgi:uncharacterized lipoprotein YbaY
VQKEAKRVAELAAAAVLAAAASPDDEPDDGETAVAGSPVGAHTAAEQPVGQHAAAPGKVTASAKVSVPPASRVGADAD